VPLFPACRTLCHLFSWLLVLSPSSTCTNVHGLLLSLQPWASFWHIARNYPIKDFGVMSQ
jgi:hypothetical protein